MSPSLASPSTPAPSSQSGQAVVEAALILPAMVFLILCALQLTLLQQARVMAEYAAFCAARTGIVRNMDNGPANSATSTTSGTSGPMRDAAVTAILPTFGRTDSFTALARTKAAFEVRDAVMRAVNLPQIRVAVLNPHKGDFTAFGKHLNNKEIDFDDARPAAAPATLLSVQVRYLFELKVPFANKMIQSIFFASHMGTLSTWSGKDMSGPRIGGDNGADALAVTNALALAHTRILDGMPGGGLSFSGLAALANRGRFYLPVNAWYTMRMQSNPFEKWAAP